MDRSASRRCFDATAITIAALILAGCLGREAPDPPKPEPVTSICSIPYPPTLTVPEVKQTPPRLARWTAGTKVTLERNRCPAK